MRLLKFLKNGKMTHPKNCRTFITDILVFALISTFFIGCASKDKKDADIKAQEIKPSLDKTELLNSKETLGVNKDQEIVIQKKTKLVDYLREVSYQVRRKQDDLYGSRRFDTRGLYGKYEECVAQKHEKPKVARLMVLKDDEYGQIAADRFGYDDKGELIVLEDSKLRDKIREMEDKKNRLFAQEEELIAELNLCEGETKP